MNSNGEYDSEFGESGVLNIYSFESDTLHYDDLGSLPYLYDINVRPNNTVLINGFNQDQREILRLNYDGSYDLTFGVAGIVNSSSGEYLKVDSDENIYSIANYFSTIVIGKYSQNGVRDYNYGNSGILTIEADSIGVGEHNMWIEGLDIESNNNLLCAARVETGDVDKSVIIRITPNGILDPTFGENGIRKIILSEFGSDEENNSGPIFSMLDGNIVWGGFETIQNRVKRLFLAKLNNNGSANTSFAYNGMVFNDYFYESSLTNFFADYEFVIRPDNQDIVIATSKNDTLYFARYLNSRTYSSTHVSGDVAGEWEGIDTVYVDGDITIPEDSTLTINPGTHVYFTGEYKFDVYGTLTANGNETDSIFFASDSLGEISSYPYYKGYWYGITFHSTDSTNQSTSSLNYCSIKYGFGRWLDEASLAFNRRFGGGLIFYKSNVDVKNTSLFDCNDGHNKGGVITSIYSSGNLDNIYMNNAGSISLLESEVSINGLNSTNGFGIYAENSNGILKNSKIYENGYYRQWGTLNFVESEFLLSSCEISDNPDMGIYAQQSELTIERSLVKGNGGDGGLFIESPATITNCEIIENGGEGLSFNSETQWETAFNHVIKNSLVTKNSNAGMRFQTNNNASVTNCIIADNTSSDSWGGIKTYNAEVNVRNSIVHQNGSNYDFQAGGFYTYSIIQGNYVGSDTATTNLQNVDPLFRDAANDDYHLQSIACGYGADSPGIDAGDPNIGDYVLDCETGGLGTMRSDIGAYGGAGNWWDISVLPICHFAGEVSGIWDCEDIYVDGDIIIPEGDTLQISKTVNSVHITGPYQIKVEGVLLAIGPENNGEVTDLNGNFINFQGSALEGEECKGIYFNNLNNTNPGTSIIENCRFDYADKMDMTYQGGGAIAIYNSDNVIVRGSVFYLNQARLGGAIYIENSNAHIENCYFDLNGKERGQYGEPSATAGGAMYIKDSNPYLHRLKFINNQSISGGGAMILENSSPVISNVLFVKNITNGLGGAVQCFNGSSPKFVNMTSADNVAIQNGGGTFHTNGDNTELEVINSIMYGNSKPELFIEGQTPVITYSIIDSASTESYFGIGCLDTDPKFEMTIGNYYYLSSTVCGYSLNSDAIDAGHPDSLDAVLDCEEGLGTQRADMGYYGGRYSDMPVGVKDEIETQIPNKYELAQNYPNPFNPSTTIQFAIPKAGMVSLKVYNILGEEVATLINRKMNAGFQKINFDASHLSSGLYLYRISADDFVDVKKMLLVK